MFHKQNLIWNIMLIFCNALKNDFFIISMLSIINLPLLEQFGSIFDDNFHTDRYKQKELINIFLTINLSINIKKLQSIKSEPIQSKIPKPNKTKR